jgi:activator of 2-hydroxyglutaryl-CoA dehydratase
MEKVVLLRDRVEEFRFPVAGRVPAFLGIDIGSVSTNLALVTESGDLIHGIYTMTRGRPAATSSACSWARTWSRTRSRRIKPVPCT